ncbi:MAG: hypothetical protein ACOCWD_04545, partial [Tangfeifania sp.]
QRFNSDYYEFKASQIELLSEARKNYVKSVTVNIPLDKINESIISEIEKLAQNNKGSALLKFNVYDPENNMFINLFSRSKRINLSDGFLHYFKGRPEIGYRIN